MNSEQQPLVQKRSALKGLAFFVLVLALGVTLIIWKVTQDNFERSLSRDFNNQADQVHDLIQTRLDIYADILYGAQALFGASRSVERSEWNEFLQYGKQKKRYEDVISIGYIERVSEDEKEFFIERMRNDRSVDPLGLPSYTIHPESTAGEYFPVTFVQTESRRESRLGFDMASKPERKAAMDYARDHQALGMAAGKDIFDDQLVMVLFLPIYHKGVPHAESKDLRAALQGFVYLSCRIKDVVADAFRDEVISKGLYLEMFEGGASEKGPGFGAMVVNSREASPEAKRERIRFEKILKIDFGGRVLTLRVTTGPEFNPDNRDKQAPVFVALYGFAASLLSFGIIFLLGTGQLRAQEMARQMTRELRASEKRLQSMIQDAPDAVISLDLSGVQISVNAMTEQITGYPAAEMEGKKFSEQGIVSPPFLPKAMDHFAGIVRGEKRGSIEAELIRKDGRPVFVEANAQLIRNEENVPSGVQVILRDITARKKSEVQMRLLSQIAEQSPVSVVVTDLEGNIEYVNAKFEEVSGYTRQEALGKNPRILNSGETPRENYKELWSALARGREWRGKFHNKRKDGTLYWEFASIAPVYDDTGKITHYLAIKEDITEREKVEAQLVQAQKMESVGTLAGGIAHDFNNLLTVINGYAEMALDKLPPDHSLRVHLQEISKAGMRARDLTGQLLAFSRRQVVKPALVNLNTMLFGMDKMLKRLLGEKVEIVVIPGDLLKIVEIDPGQMGQVIMNLAVNARDAMPEGGKIVFQTENVTLKPGDCVNDPGLYPGSYVKLSVTDTGMGMSSEVKKHLFEPFFTTKGLGKGTGLGLATCYGIIKKMNGYIAVRSETGKGTRFEIFLPPTDKVLQGSETGAEGAAVPQGAGNILLVEDESTVREFCAHILTASGFTIFVAKNGAEAVSLFKELVDGGGKIDLLLTDVVMPQMGGKEAADKIRQILPGIRVLFMSGYTDDSLNNAGVLGADVELIEKPFTRMELVDKINRILNR